MNSFKILNKNIGYNKPTFIISEIGINHNGSVEQCAKMILKSKQSGADSVKLQISDARESYHKKSTSHNIFKKNSLSKEEIIKLKKYAKNLKIILFATVGDFKSLGLIKKLMFPAAKISSGLLTNEPLIKEISKLKIPVILSSGMSFKKEIFNAINIVKKYNNNSGVAVLKCTSLYPAPYETINLAAIKAFNESFKIPIGYSDHTIGNLACLSAVSMGSKIIEKHFTLDKTQRGLDHKLSADPKDLKQLITDIRNIEKIRGSSIIMPNKLELMQRTKMHRKIFACKNINSDEVFTLKNISLKRGYKKSNALDPKYFFKVLGKKAKKKINDDEAITKSKIK